MGYLPPGWRRLNVIACAAILIVLLPLFLQIVSGGSVAVDDRLLATAFILAIPIVIGGFWNVILLWKDGRGPPSDIPDEWC